MLRFAAKQVFPQSSRQFSTASAVNSGFFDQLKQTLTFSKKNEESEKSKRDEIIANLEEADKSDDKSLERKVIFLGNSDPLDRANAKDYNFTINQWKNKLVASPHDITLDFLNENFLRIYTEVSGQSATVETLADFSLDDLKLRFTLFKKLQQEIGIEIPDYVLTTSHTLSPVYNYLQNLITNPLYNDKEPNAIHLFEEDFAAYPNIRIQNHVDNNERRKKMDNIMEQIRKVQDEEFQKGTI